MPSSSAAVRHWPPQSNHDPRRRSRGSGGTSDAFVGRVHRFEVATAISKLVLAGSKFVKKVLVRGCFNVLVRALAIEASGEVSVTWTPTKACILLARALHS